MSATAAARQVRELAKQDKIYITKHALERMTERKFTYEGIKRALSFAVRAVASTNDSWEIYGKDDDGRDCKVVVAIKDSIIVITVM